MPNDGRSATERTYLEIVGQRYAELMERRRVDLLMPEDATLGQVGYDAYGKVTNYLNYQGLPMPIWVDLSDKIREAWEAAMQAGLIVAKMREMQVAKPDRPWLSKFDERQQNQIRFARLYAREFHHGADGHNSMMIMAQMADLLDVAEVK